jgi:L-ascorbate metabolism protein UlaG (beta-lactamase superfamily)
MVGFHADLVQNACHTMRVRLIRHATLLVELAGVRLLIDPQLDPAGSRPPITNTPSPRSNPLVELPEPANLIVRGLAAVLVTHLHGDHLDQTAVELLPRHAPIVCQPPDSSNLRLRGFADVRPVEESIELEGIRITRTGGQHGTGEIGAAMGPVSGFILAADGDPSLYIAGDTIWCDEVEAALAEHRPHTVVVNAGGARFNTGDPITMTAEDVVAVTRHDPSAHVVAVHMEAINHCLETRSDLHQRLRAEGLGSRVTVPEDGALVPL